MSQLSKLEIRAGLFLTLLPEVLVEHGASANCDKEKWVQGRHSFLCLSATAFNGRWLPFYSLLTSERKTLSMEGRTGHPDFWVLNTGLHYFEGQVWTATHEAIIAAANGHDFSSKGKRNMMARPHIPKIA